MAKNLTPKQKETTSLVIEALRKLDNKNGVTVNDVANYLVSEHSMKKKTAVSAVRMTLVRGVAFGAMDRIGKTYTLNQDFAESIICGRRRRRRRRRGRSRSRRRGKRRGRRGRRRRRRSRGRRRKRSRRGRPRKRGRRGRRRGRRSSSSPKKRRRRRYRSRSPSDIEMDSVVPPE